MLLVFVHDNIRNEIRKKLRRGIIYKENNPPVSFSPSKKKKKNKREIIQSIQIFSIQYFLSLLHIL